MLEIHSRNVLCADTHINWQTIEPQQIHTRIRGERKRAILIRFLSILYKPNKNIQPVINAQLTQFASMKISIKIHNANTQTRERDLTPPSKL